MTEEILVVKKERGRGNDKMNFKVVEKRLNSWAPPRYQKVFKNKDFRNLAFLLYDLNQMGYPIEKAFHHFKRLLNEPDLFFL